MRRALALSAALAIMFLSSSPVWANGGADDSLGTPYASISGNLKGLLPYLCSVPAQPQPEPTPIAEPITPPIEDPPDY
jgi:hypothetical protein